MSTLSLSTSQILLWNYLFWFGEKKGKKNLNYSSQSTFPAKQNWGEGGREGEREGGEGRREGGREEGGIHSGSLAYEKRLTTI